MSNLGWYHCILTTYGAWLPGDPRGFRTRHHREHIEGDYKHPPPKGTYDARHQQSLQLMKFAPAVLSSDERAQLGQACVDHLASRCNQLLSLAMCAQHLHLQMRCHEPEVISILAGVKRHLWYVRRESGCSDRLWGVGRKIIPIESRQHQEAVLKYILAHQREGAWTWNWRVP